MGEWACETPGGQVRMSGLPLDVMIGLEDQLGEEWWQIAAHPFRKAKVAKAVYDACCALRDSAPKPLTVGDLSSVFVEVDDDLPTVMDGPNPKAADETSIPG